MGLFDKLFKKNRTQQPENIRAADDTKPETTAQEAKMEYALIRVLPNHMTDESLQEKNTYFMKLLELSLQSTLPLIGTTPVLIYYTDSAKIGVQVALETIKQFFEKNHISVLSIHPHPALGSGQQRYMSEELLKKTVRGVYNGEYIIFLTHGPNIDNYMIKKHPGKPYMQVGYGQGVSSNGDLLG